MRRQCPAGRHPDIPGRPPSEAGIGTRFRIRQNGLLPLLVTSTLDHNPVSPQLPPPFLPEEER